MKNVKICLIGAGRAGELHGDVYHYKIPNVTITCIFDTNIDKAKALAKKYGVSSEFAFNNYDRALNNSEFDAVVITTPTFTHCDYVLISARNKKHIFCEKPMAISTIDCDKMIEACKREDVTLQIGFMRRFDEGFLKAKEIIRSGQIGEPLIIRSNTRGPGLPGKWAFNIKNSNGNLAEVNSHDFDSIRWLADSEFSTVYAVAKNSKNPKIGKDYPQFYDNATVSITMKNKTFGLIDSVCPCDYGYDARAEVVGTKGVIFIGSLGESTAVTCTRKTQIVSPQILSWKKRFHEAYIAEDRHFIDCILEGSKPIVDGSDGKKAVEVVVCANESIASGKPVEV
jgi:scyllo-inositol 2-dehydrogenase (NAD+)